MSQEKLYGLFSGDVKKAWPKAADLSATCHVITKDKPFHTVLGCTPLMYDELWTAGKMMYKLEQVVAVGGRLIIYGPHITKISRTWGSFIEEVGYHVRDYFLFSNGSVQTCSPGSIGPQHSCAWRRHLCRRQGNRPN